MSADTDTVRDALDCLVDEREARGARVADVARAISALDRLAAAEAQRDTLAEAASNAKTWIENYPLNTWGADFANGWTAIRDDLDDALAAVAPTEAAE